MGVRAILLFLVGLLVVSVLGFARYPLNDTEIAAKQAPGLHDRACRYGGWLSLPIGNRNRPLESCNSGGHRLLSGIHGCASVDGAGIIDLLPGKIDQAQGREILCIPGTERHVLHFPLQLGIQILFRDDQRGDRDWRRICLLPFDKCMLDGVFSSSTKS